MEKKKLLNKALGIATSVALVAGMPLVAFADGGTNISSQTIPVTATIDSYYVVDVPAGLDGSGNLNLTRENNAYITDEVASSDPFYNKKEATFYGYTSVGMSGIIDSTKKVHVGLTCADLEKSGDSTTTAPIRLENLPITTTEGKTLVQNVQTLWNTASDEAAKEAAKVTLPTTWAVGSTGITMDFTSTTQNMTGATISDTNHVEQFAMLKTVLPVNGTYNGNLVVTFSLTNA